MENSKDLLAAPLTPNKKRRKKNKENNDIKEQSTKKKKKSPQHRTKKKNRKNNKSNGINGSNNYHKKKKKKQNHPFNQNRKRKQKYKKKHYKKRKECHYRVGVVMIIPQNDNIWGWIHSKHDNMMYRLSYSKETITLQRDERILFTSRQHKKGLNTVKDIEKMCIVPLDTVYNKYLNNKNESIASNDTLVLNTIINRNESNGTEFKSFLSVNYNKKFKGNLIKMIEKYLNGFVNMNGGRIYIGINDKGIVKGIDFINKKEFDLMQQMLPERLNKWEPQIYTRSLIKSLKLEMKDILNIDNKENCAYILPKYKVIQVSIESIYDDIQREQIIFGSSDGFVYCREGTSLAVYADSDMTTQQKCGKKLLNTKGYNYGFWDPFNKNDKNKEKDIEMDENKNQSQSHSSSSSNTSETDESHSIVYMDSDDDETDSMSGDNQYNDDTDNDERRKSYSALFDYNGGRISNELLFKRDDEIVVNDEKQGGLYLYGYKQNQPNDKGWFPNSYVQEID